MTAGARSHRGATLIEALVACALVAMAMAISFPAAADAVESARLQTALGRSRAFLVSANHFADRYRQAVLLRGLPSEGTLQAVSEDGRWNRELSLPRDVSLVEPSAPWQLVLRPGDAMPAVRIVLASASGRRAGFQADPVRGEVQAWRSIE